MPHLSIRVRGAVPRRAPSHPKATLVGESGTTLVIPFAPEEVEHEGYGRRWEQVDRSRQSPAIVDGGPNLRRMRFELLLAKPDHQATVGEWIQVLRRLTDSGERVTFSLAGEHVWRIEALQVRTLARQHGSNAVTRALVPMELVRAVEARANLGPVTGGARPPTRPPRARPRSYVVARGDTLWTIAQRVYGDGGKWKVIAEANGIRDPRRLRVGQRLTLPAEG